MTWLKKNDVLFKAISVLLAIFLWVYIAGTNNFQEDYKAKNIKPEFLGIENLENSKNLILIGDYSVDIEISAAYYDILTLDEKDIKVEVDLTRAGITAPGTYEVPYTVELPSSAYSLKKKSPQKLSVKFDKEQLSVVPVRVMTDGITADGYVVDQSGVLITPTSLKLSGLQEDIAKISYAEVDPAKKDLKNTVSGKLGYKFYDADGKVVKNVSVQADYDSIDVTIPILKTKTVPLVLEIQGNDNLKKYVNYTFEPELIQIAGEENVINQTNELIAGTVKFSELFSQMEKSFTITPPDGIINLSGELIATAKVEVSGLQEKKISTSLIELINIDSLPDNYRIKLVTTNVNVVVFGTEASIGKVNKDNVRIVADLDSIVLSKGTHPVAVSVVIDGVADTAVANPDEYVIYVEVS